MVQVVASIAEIELPLGGWPDLIRIMLENISTDNATLKQSTLQAIGYVCETTVSLTFYLWYVCVCVCVY